jgi:O-antigen/teichoic acid export membrane protein
MLLALTQQALLIPLFLKYWTGDTLSAWFTIFAAGSLLLAADAGLHTWSLNRFLAFKSRNDCERRSNRYYGAAIRLFLLMTAALAALLLAVFTGVKPAVAFGFAERSDFDLSFAVMMTGALLTLPSGLATALYRARGLYGRVVAVQAWGTALGQLGQIVGLVVTGSLFSVVLAFVAGLVGTAIFIVFVDLRRQFPFIDGLRHRLASRISWRWSAAQFAGAFPFAVMNFAEVGLSYLSVLLIGAFVSNRVAVAQWTLTRTIAGFLKQLCNQMSLPMAAELGHDHAIGARDSLQRLYARGSVLLVLFASVITSALVAFWRDFFALWTHGSVPYDGLLAIVLLLGGCISAPAILALSYANYSNRGPLLLWTKSLQIALFLLVGFALIPHLGPLGAAIALVSSDVLVQLGILYAIILGGTLRHPLRHSLVLLAIMLAIVPGGVALGIAITSVMPGTGFLHFSAECALWLATVALIFSSLLNRSLRERLTAVIPC